MQICFYPNWTVLNFVYNSLFYLTASLHVTSVSASSCFALNFQCHVQERLESKPLFVSRNVSTNKVSTFWHRHYVLASGTRCQNEHWTLSTGILCINKLGQTTKEIFFSYKIYSEDERMALGHVEWLWLKDCHFYYFNGLGKFISWYRQFNLGKVMQLLGSFFRRLTQKIAIY